MTPEDFSSWVAVLAKPSLGIVAIFVIVFYRDTVGHVIAGLFDTIYSWLKRK